MCLANEYPSFTCYATTKKVYAAGRGFRWSLSSDPMDRRLAGIPYWRISSFDGVTARMVKGRRVEVPAISAKEEAAIKSAVPKSGNNKSNVWEASRKGRPDHTRTAVEASSKFGTFSDFAGANPPCQKP
jgi:hypothetical protein